MSSAIRSLLARQIWDSRGRPTVEVEIQLEDGATGRAIAPAGASTGSGEALDLRDGNERFGGYGVDRAVAGLREEIAPALIGCDASDQAGIDSQLAALDGTDQFRRLGGNALIAASLAVAHAAAASAQLPLWRYLAGSDTAIMPVPEIQIFGGGAHASGRIDLQDFMVVPFGAGSFREALEWVAEIHLAAGHLMHEAGHILGVADEGGYWPAFSSNEAALDALVSAVTMAGFNPEREVGLSLDIAATQLFAGETYNLRSEGRALSVDAWFEQISSWLSNYPIRMIEDPFAEHDFESHARLVSAHGSSVQIIGDDLLVTDPLRVHRAVEEGACTALLCKPNQAGTLSRARQAFEAAKAGGLSTIVSARSGESEDVSVAHLAVGWSARQVKVGAFTRSDRMAKWNELLRIEESLGADAIYAGKAIFAGGGDD